jgi:hypothetical protein
LFLSCSKLLLAIFAVHLVSNAAKLTTMLSSSIFEGNHAGREMTMLSSSIFEGTHVGREILPLNVFVVVSPLIWNESHLDFGCTHLCVLLVYFLAVLPVLPPGGTSGALPQIQYLSASNFKKFKEGY